MLAALLSWVEAGAQVPRTCNGPGCYSGWRGPLWVPADSTRVLLLQGRLHAQYPKCYIRVQVWFRCCQNGVKQVVIGAVEILGDSCQIDEDIEQGSLTAAEFMDEVAVTLIVYGVPGDTCLPGVRRCAEGGNYYYEVYKGSCYGWLEKRVRWISCLTRPKDEQIADVRPLDDDCWVKVREWVRCTDACCADGWIICRVDEPCTPRSPNYDPCVQAIKVQEGIAVRECPRLGGSYSECKPVCKDTSRMWRGNDEPPLGAGSAEAGRQIRVRVYDVLGRQIAERRVPELHGWQDEVARWVPARGVYVVVIGSGTGARVERIVVP